MHGPTLQVVPSSLIETALLSSRRYMGAARIWCETARRDGISGRFAAR
ncbi:hypothetical protein BRPE64_ECDS00450 (plasmid) [Caballeronia insecticola]|uniref:Uncharacterized protein n=1 Tax=Caballeronia insecticola TaxID=758793 RepID=R4WUE2_9BURK|nr:hypothetical protein BRPE64_ECDS00450 [Caballeronia insecticola]